MGANEELGDRSGAAGDASARQHGRVMRGGRLAGWEDRLLRGPGRVLDHPALLRVMVVVGVLAATALSFNLVETAPSSGLLGGSTVGGQSPVTSFQAVTPHIVGGDSCGNQSLLDTQSGDQGSHTCPSTTTTTPVLPGDKALQIGDTWSDSATVSGSAGAPTGTVTFYVCSPTQLNGGSHCTSGIGTQIASGGGITNPVTLTPQNGTSSTATSPSVTPNKVGTWCFGGYYSGQSSGQVEGALDPGRAGWRRRLGVQPLVGHLIERVLHGQPGHAGPHHDRRPSGRHLGRQLLE